MQLYFFLHFLLTYQIKLCKIKSQNKFYKIKF